MMQVLKSQKTYAASTSAKSGDGITYLLAPPNNICAKLIHTENAINIEPKVDVTIEGLNLEWKIRKFQLSQLIQTLNTFHTLERQKLVAFINLKSVPQKILELGGNMPTQWLVERKLTSGRKSMKCFSVFV